MHVFASIANFIVEELQVMHTQRGICDLHLLEQLSFCQATLLFKELKLGALELKCHINNWFNHFRNRIEPRCKNKESIFITHTFFTSWITVNAASRWSNQYMFGLPNVLSHSLLEHFPLYSIVLQQYVRESPFVRSDCRHLPCSVINPITRHQRRQLTP